MSHQRNRELIADRFSSVRVAHNAACLMSPSKSHGHWKVTGLTVDIRPWKRFSAARFPIQTL